jgi:hypothetical protein
MRFSKQAAAAAQIETAIDLFLAGDLVCVITLAGAAEDSLAEDSSGRSFTDAISRLGPSRTGLTEKQLFSDHFNKIRNWLKHHQADTNDLEICREDAVIMLLRAYTKFYAVCGEEALTPSITSFEKWFRLHYPHWLSYQSVVDQQV